MKRISYGGASFLTADRVADSLLLLVAAIRDCHSAEVVELPAVGSDGEPVVVQLVVSPTSEIISMSEAAPGERPGTAPGTEPGGTKPRRTKAGGTEPGITELEATKVVDYLLDRIQDLSASGAPTKFETKAEADSDGWDDPQVP